MAKYSNRYRTPSPHFPQPSSTSLERLLASWERLRELDTQGYRTSAATPLSTWLVQLAWADGRVSGRSRGRGTTCSPFVTQSVAMAYSATDCEPYRPVLTDGRALPILFSHAANGVLRADNRSHQRSMATVGMTLADNEWPRPIIFFNMGYAVEPEQLRRGDAVQLDWMNGGGHAVFCWDVHLNDRGEVDAFLYVSSNGSMANGGSGGGVSVGGTSKGAGGFIGKHPQPAGEKVPEYFAARRPLFVDDERYIVEGAWVTWDDEVADKLLTDMRARPKTRVKKVKRVKAARFHGIDVSQIPLFAMGQDAPAPFSASPRDESVPEVRTAPVTEPDEVTALQRRLKLLNLINWISADTGKIDGILGIKTTAAIVAFQRAYGLRADGKPGPFVLAKLESVFRSALAEPKVNKQLDPEQPSGLTSASKSWKDGAALYFRHGVVAPGTPVELILAGENLPERPLDVTLLDADTKDPLCALPGALQPIGDRASLALRLEPRTADRRIIARLDGFGLTTAAPLRVFRKAASARQT